MRIGYQKDYDPDISNIDVIKLYDFNYEELILFKEFISELKDNINYSLDLQHFITKSNISLSFKVDENPLGLISLKNNSFLCSLKQSQYDHIILKIDHLLINDLNGYHWLIDSETNIDFLLSKGGGW